jgi:hypothetical protein
LGSGNCLPVELEALLIDKLASAQIFKPMFPAIAQMLFLTNVMHFQISAMSRSSNLIAVPMTLSCCVIVAAIIGIVCGVSRLAFHEKDFKKKYNDGPSG